MIGVPHGSEIITADLRACGLPDTVRLYTWVGSPNVAVDAWAANSTSRGIDPEAGKDPVTALVTVADVGSQAGIARLETGPVAALGANHSSDLFDGVSIGIDAQIRKRGML